MIVTRNDTATRPAPAVWATGAIWLDPVTDPSVVPGWTVLNVHFEPGARTVWHTHPRGQLIWVLEGEGRCQRRGGPVTVLRPGDRVFFEPGEDHWHGAAPDRLMTHVAMYEADEQGKTADWGEPVSDADYAQPPTA